MPLCSLFLAVSLSSCPVPQRPFQKVSPSWDNQVSEMAMGHGPRRGGKGITLPVISPPLGFSLGLWAHPTYLLLVSCLTWDTALLSGSSEWGGGVRDAVATVGAGTGPGGPGLVWGRQGGGHVRGDRLVKRACGFSSAFSQYQAGLPLLPAHRRARRPQTPLSGASPLPCSLGWAARGWEGGVPPGPAPLLYLRPCDRLKPGTAGRWFFSLLLSAWWFPNSLGLAFIYRGWHGPIRRRAPRTGIDLRGWRRDLGNVSLPSRVYKSVLIPVSFLPSCKSAPRGSASLARWE